jgi:hypothetical protein
MAPHITLSGIGKAITDVVRKIVLGHNLNWSALAVKHVLETLKVQGSNWDYYQKGAGTYEYYARKAAAESDPVKKQALLDEAEKHKDKLDVCLYEKVRPEVKKETAATKPKSMIDLYRITASKAGLNGCGNCGENSILAFLFLYDRGIRPIERVGVDLDHAFVVIGREPGDINDFTSWGPVAAICDPWAQGLQGGKSTDYGTYPGTEFETKMTYLLGGKFKINKLYRED